MLINDPETVAELQALYPRYETALVTNDVDTLTRMFWASPHAMRFGISENLRGIDEIESFREGRAPANLAPPFAASILSLSERTSPASPSNSSALPVGKPFSTAKARSGCACPKAGAS
jgi:hypothetical protein